MRTFMVAFALSFLAALLFTWLARELALRLGLVDAPVGGRKIHQRPIPRTGGIAVAAAFFLPLLGLTLYNNDISTALLRDVALLKGLLVGAGIILAVGIVDDIKNTPAILKLVGQIAVGLALWWAGIRIEVLTIPFAGVVHLGVLSLPLSVFWVVLVVNALNLIDGMDGLASGVAVLAGGTLFVMSVVEGNVLGALLLAAMVGATLGFMLFNFNPASIFLGDTGSLFLGFILALASTHSSQKSYTLFSIVAAFMALGLPIFDLAMAVVRRGLTGKPLFSADQHHVHHLLLRRGLSQRQSAALLFLAAGALGALALLFVYSSNWASALTLVVLATIIGVSIHVLGYGEIIRSGRRRMLMGDLVAAAEDRASRVDTLRLELMEAHSLDELWERVHRAADALGLEELRLTVHMGADGGSEQRDYRWTRAGGAADAQVHIQGLQVRDFPVHLARHELGLLQLSWLTERALFEPLQMALGRIVADSVAHAVLDQRGLSALPGRDAQGRAS
jgi:UDP-GlcNAc:undecaprenyl-phosphate/decaprenyl-phosphate GlcNAc-1-phosphate transferase